MISKHDIDAARNELDYKSKEQIERETALKWAARAIAAYRLFIETGDHTYMWDAVDYHHEAVEHAAETDILPIISATLAEEKAKAMNVI